MRSLSSLLLLGLPLLLTACGTEEAGKKEAGPAATEATDGPAAKAKSSGHKRPEKAEGGALEKPAEPLPAAVPVDGYPQVAIQGYGLRLELNPPFQAAVIAPPSRPDEAAPADPGRLIVSWWDVTAKGAGQSGIVGLNNTVIIPGKPQPDAPLVAGISGEGRRKKHTLTQGEGGSVVEFPRGVSDLGGAMTVKVGPVDPAWTVVVGDAPPVPWVEGQLLHSGNPAEGGAIFFDGRPKQPWGPWPEVPAAPQATAAPEAAGGGAAPVEQAAPTTP